MGLSSKKSKSTSTTNQQTSMTSTPTNPEWTTNLISGVAGKVADLGNLDPYSLVAGADPLQTQAGQAAGGLQSLGGYGAQGGNGYADVMNAGPQSITAQNNGNQDISSYISRFLNPYTQNVVDSSLASYDDNSGRQMGQANLDLAGDATFGGSGGSIYKSLLGGQLALGRGQLESGLRSDGFNTALGAAGQQAGLNQQNGQFNSGLAQDASLANANFAETALTRKLAGQQGLDSFNLNSAANDRANIQQQAGMGDMLRQIEAARAMAPVSLTATQAGLASSLPFGLFQGQTQNGTMSGTTNTTSKVSDPMGSIGGLIGGLGGLASGVGALGGLGGLGSLFGAGSTLAKANASAFAGLGGNGS